MKYVSEYRNADKVKILAKALDNITTQHWTIMEVCGGQTHAIMKYGLHLLLPEKIRLIHGPGCPVCVTSMEIIDHALFIAEQENTIFCTFGDMLRVPGTSTDLLTLKARGAKVQMIHSPLEVLTWAKLHKDKQVVFFAVGFETTAPANAMLVYQAKKLGLSNFSMLVSHVLVPPALKYILESKDNEVQGFLAAGHVCTVTGFQEYPNIAKSYQVPIIVTGFEPVDILQGLYQCVTQLETNRCEVYNQYQRCVQLEGNPSAQTIVNTVFKVIDQHWRGIGKIPASGLALNAEYSDFDASLRFPFFKSQMPADNGCISGEIMLGKKRPNECPLFGKECTPQKPFGAPMVSTEGACASYYRYALLEKTS